MNIHEYQAKAVLKEFGVPGARGGPVLKAADAEADEHLREAKVNARWARTMLDRDGFADALTHIIQGGAS